MVADAIVIAVCAALLVAGVGMVIRWGGAPETGAPAPSLVRYGLACAAAGAVAGVIAAGAAGRLVMGLLALTSPRVSGALTEADAVIGQVTIGGTLGFIIFVGLPAGLMSGILYAVAGPVLPRGRAGGLAVGAILLVLVGSRLEPLRADNIDFRLVGPDWLSVSAFVGLALFQGLLVQAVAARLWPYPLPRPRSPVLGRRSPSPRLCCWRCPASRAPRRRS